MYKNLIENICTNENLIDIASLGKATQSSQSKWSKKGDAQRAVNNSYINASFSFHTNKEPNPWWQLEFDYPVKLSYIIINNRRQKQFQWIASSLQVIVTTDADDEIIIHKGKVHFDCLPNGLPLILPVANEFSIKKIKIKLDAHNYLHLGQIHCLTQKSLQYSNDKLIYLAVRQDGLGERLRAIVEAIKLANENNGGFYFSWEDKGHEFHSVDKVKRTFNQKYIDDHYIELKEVKSLNTIPLSKTKNISKDYLMLYDGIIVSQGSRPSANEFNSIGFSKELKIAQQKALNIELPKETVAIHLRAGDIVYGIYRFNNLFYSKVVPVYVIDILIKRLKMAGYGVIVFGQDLPFCRHLSKKYNVLFAGDMVNTEFSKFQAAIFDIVLMSRCTQIFAKKSGFAILSSMIGNSGRIMDYDDVFTESELISAFNESMKVNGLLHNVDEGLSPLLKAFSISQFVDTYQDKLPTRNKLDLITESVELDSNNFFYKLLQSIFLYELNELDKADAVLMNAIESDSNYYGLNRLASHKDWRGNTILESYLEFFKIARDKGSIVASIPILLHEFYEGTVNFDSYYKMTSDKKTIGCTILHKKLNELKKQRNKK